MFDGYFVDADVSATVAWFDDGGSVTLGDGLPASALVVEASKVPGLIDLAGRVGPPPGRPRRSWPRPWTSCSKDSIR